MSEPEGSRVVRQLRHDVDDVYELLSDVAEAQRAYGGELGEMSQAVRSHGDRLERVEERLDGIEGGQRQILELLRDGRPGP
ncbi:MAG: hypothetical protein L0H84_24290 [Pseudonocardia sp.]|nr:hypothetical protein [Pseudonocardia sp.]